MEHVAIDLGGRESQICVRAADGRVLEERRWPTRELGKYLAKRPPGRVVMETCAEAFAVADMAIASAHEARIVPATLVRSLGVGARRTKTDRRDAQVLSEVSTRIDLVGVHIPSPQARHWRSLSTARESLVSARTQLINSVRGWLRTQAMRPRTGASETFTRRVRDKMLRPSFVEMQLAAIDALSEQIAKADKELGELAKQDPICERLMSVPGVGPVTAVRFVAALDEVTRFESAHKVEAYLGLTPGENSSSERKRRTGMTKAGPPAVRRALTQAAWCIRRCARSHPMAQWALEVEKRRGKRIAIIALCRKLAGILFALWRDGTYYDVTRGAMRRD